MLLFQSVFLPSIVLLHLTFISDSDFIMSESFALLRRRRSDDLAKLADQHLQNDLQADDRDALKSAASTVSLWTTVGSAVGLGLGLYAAIRLRSNRKAFFAAIRAQEKPTKVVFADGRTGMFQISAS
jgi:hypothetical protein